MNSISEIHVGARFIIQKEITESETSLDYGNGRIEKLLASPKLLGLMIEASVHLIDDMLPDDLISVGKRYRLNHLKPTTLGQTVTVEVEVIEYDHPWVLVRMKAYDEIGLVGTGSEERIIVNKDGLLINASQRASIIEKSI